MSIRNFVLTLMLTVTLSVTVTYVMTKNLNTRQENAESTVNGVKKESEQPVFCEVELLHESTYKKIRPLLFAENKCENVELSDLKSALSHAIQSNMDNGKLSRAAVYFRDLNHTTWTAVNGQESFHPASMLKLVIMMNILKQAELNPNLFLTKVKLDKSVDHSATIQSTHKLVVGNEYTVMQLLEAMMKRSDNDATSLLFRFIDKSMYTELFDNLKLTVPDEQDFYYSINPIEFSKFYRLLYHASYLNRSASEYALKLMEGSEFMGGLQQSLPHGASLVHKFGERETKDGLYQFHDSGIVYLKGNAYLIIAMTEGKNMDTLKSIVPELASVCYEFCGKN